VIVRKRNSRFSLCGGEHTRITAFFSFVGKTIKLFSLHFFKNTKKEPGRITLDVSDSLKRIALYAIGQFARQNKHRKLIPTVCHHYIFSFIKSQFSALH
jgi:hypothetical protein